MSVQRGDAKLAAPCGLYCGACPVFRATASGDSASLQRIAQTMDVSPEQVNCLGCLAEKGRPKILEGRVCPTYRCCIEQKGLQFCYQCQDFPCLKLAPCADRAQILPHNNKVYNLVLMQKLGLEEWLNMAQELWRQYFTDKWIQHFSGKKEGGGDKPKA